MSKQPPSIQLDDVLITEELARRSPRQPDLRLENRALRSLARQLVHEPEVMLQSLVNLAVDLCGNTSTAGVSLVETQPDGDEVFRWVVLAGTLANQVGNCTPRHFSHCGVCLEQRAAVLFSHPERYFTYFQATNTPFVETLVLPLVAEGEALGTIWMIAHDEGRQFDPEDVRLMGELADFTAAALLRNQQHAQALQATHARLAAEEADRRLAETQAQALVANLPGGAAFVVDRDLRYQVAAGEALSLAGFEPEHVMGRTIFEVLPPELAANYEPFYRQALAGESFECEHQAHGRWYITRGTPLRTEGGEIYAALAVSYDITDRKRVEDDRKQSEAALRESEARLQSIANLVPDLLWDSEPDGSTNWYNQRWMEYTGQTFEQAIGWGWIDVVHPDDREESARRYREAVEQGMPLQQEHRIRKQDGAYRWFVVKASPLKDESGKVIKMYGAATDIHEQRVALEALRESEEKYRSLFDSMDEGVSTFEVVFGEDGEPIDLIFIENNPAFTAVTGLPADVIGKRTSEVVPNLERFWLETYGRVVKTGVSERFESSNVDTDGNWYDVYAARVGEGSSRVVIVYNNITDRKRAEQTLRESEEQQAFLLKFSDALRTEPDADAVANRAIRMLCERMQLDLCYIGVYRLVDDRADFTHQVGNDRVPPLPDGIRLSDFPEALRVAFDRTLVIDDIAETEGLSDTDRRNIAALGFRALVAATLRKGENKPLWAIVAVSARPRRWTRGEIALVEAVTERTWATMERARAEAALRQSEAKYRSLFNSMDEAFAVVEVLADENGEWNDFLFLEVNPAFVKQTGMEYPVGCKATELLGTPNPRWAELYGRVAATGEPMRLEEDEATLDRVFDLYVFRLGEAGSRRVAVLFTDISDRKRAEEQQAFLLKFSDALRAEPDADSVANRAVRMLAEHLHLDRCWLSEVFEQQDISTVGPEYHRPDLPPMSGVFRLSDYPKTMRQLATQPMVIHDVASSAFSESEKALLDQLHLRALLVVALRKGQHQVIWAMAAAMTTPRHWNESERVLLEEVGEYVWAAIERARAEAALRESEEKYRLLFTSINEGYALCEMMYDDNETPIDWKILEVNPAFESMTGFTQAAGKSARELNQVLNPNWLQTLATVAQTGASTRFEHHVSGIDYWFEILVSRIDADKQHIIVVFNNITVRKRAEASLRQSEARYRTLNQQLEQRVQERTAQLEALNQELEAFSRSISHDLKTPLNYISMVAGLLPEQLDSTQLNETSLRYLDIIAQSATEARAMVDDLLEFSRMGRAEMRWITVPMNLLVQQVRQQLQPEIAGRSIDWQIEPLPDVQGDMAMLRLVWQNLLANALKYSRDRATAVITIGSSNHEHETVFFVQDNGAGFDMKYCDRLFNIFQRLHSQKQFDGTGVGLANVRRIVHRHGGRTWAEGAIDRGATVYFSLPKREVQT